MSRERVPRRVQHVEKRDGRVVPFDVGKIRAAIAAALEAAGQADEGFAAEVAGVVELTLNEAAARAAGTPGARALEVPPIEHVQDLVEKALMELGASGPAKAYILYRDRRARVREALQVHAGDAPRRSTMRVREMEGISAWSKGRITAALMEEAELPRAAAEEVASAVEGRVFASGLHRITTSLIRELVASELFERGWTHALRRQDQVGLARHDLRRALGGRSLLPWEDEQGGVEDGERRGVRATVAGEILRRFALEDVLPEDAAELHRAGDLHVEGLETCHRPLSMAVEAELLAPPGGSVQSAFSLLDEAAAVARGVARVLVLEDPGPVLAPLVRAARPSSPLGLAGWLRGLGAVARGVGVRLDLGSSGPRFATFTARLVEELAELPPGPFAPRLFLEGHELEDVLTGRSALAPAVERLLSDGRLISTWSDEGERFAAPGCRRLRRERGALVCGGAIALNLPRLARRGGPWREEIVQTGLAELVQASLALARSLETFQRAPERGTRGATRPRARFSYAIVPVGLREALLVLGDGEIDPHQGARLLGLLSEAATRFSFDASSVVSPCPFFGSAAAARFAWLDRRAARAAGTHQGLLFAETEPGEAPRPYGTGFALSSPAARGAPRRAGRAEAEVLRTLPVGALSLRGVPRVADRDEEHPHLAAWRRFEVHRRAHTGELSLELFSVPPQPLPSSATAAAEPVANLRPLL